MGTDVPATDAIRPVHPRALLTYAALLVVPLAVMAALGVVAYSVASRSADALIRNNNTSAAMMTKNLVEEEFQLRVNGLRALARSPGLVAAIRAGDVDGVRDHLGAVVVTHPKVVRAFVTDPAGLLWSDYPEAPESLGENFAYRQWFEGLSADWQPYVSPVYQRFAEPQLLLVAVAVPVLDPSSEDVLGALVMQVELEGLTALLSRVQVGETGYVFLVDHRGNVAAHPGLDLQGGLYDDYSDTRPVRDVMDEPRTVPYVDPVTGVSMLSTAIRCDVPGATWTAVAQQPLLEAYEPVRVLGFQIAAAVALFAAVMAGFVWWMVRSDARVRRLTAQLTVLNTDLERRVEKRTRELHETQSQLVQAQKMEAIGRLAGGVAHDFNNLLTVISGYAGILLSKSSNDKESLEEIGEIKDAASRATALTRQLLAFSRRQVLRPVVLDVNEVVAGMGKLLERLIGEDVDLVTKLEPNLRKVRFDPGQIEQIIMNLAVNARDAMPGGGKVTIETGNVELDEDYAGLHAEVRPGPHVLIALTDTGDGMSADTRARIFDPFFTTKELGKGTGLGLSTVYGIVKQSGGNIWVYSEPGQGTVFKVYLPAVLDEESAQPVPVRKPVRKSGTESILVVEDDQAVRALIGRILTKDGYSVMETGDPEEAVTICEQRGGEIDLVLTDVVMPGMNGRELSERILSVAPDTRIVFMSGYTDDAIIHHGVLEAGVSFIEKPITPETLLRKMREFLES